MKKVIFASVFALTLAACGGGNKATKLRIICEAEGWSTRAGCECISNLAVKKLGGDVLDAATISPAAAAKLAIEYESNPEKFAEHMESVVEFATFLSEAAPTCSAE